MSSPKQSKSGLVHLLNAGNNNPRFVPPVLREVGKLAAGVASVSTSATGSATGNPRNKCALQPGHSLMDWIRLGNSGKDLTGVGSQAGLLTITPSELASHNRLTNAWLAIRGKVYNVTNYLPFHPGGPEELMKGVGKDATSLFDEIHAWVNYESILQKCLVGRLVPVSPSKIPDNLFVNDREPPKNNQKTIQVKSCSQIDDTSSEFRLPELKKDQKETVHQGGVHGCLPRFDWLQKTKDISVFFYTPALANPLIEIRKVENMVYVTLVYNNRMYTNELVFFEDVRWPCEVIVSHETGKIECKFIKVTGKIWNNYGVLKQDCREVGEFSGRNKISYVVGRKVQVASDIFLLELERSDGARIVVPVGYHVNVFAGGMDESFSKSYTPVPSSLFTRFGPQKYATNKICLMVKRYPEGFMSKHVCDTDEGGVLHLSKPLFGGLTLSTLEKKEIFLILAAGTGITPMLSVIVFLLERRVRRSQSIRLIFCNRKLGHVPFLHQLNELKATDCRFGVEHILSEPDGDWGGLKGHITGETVRKTVEEQVSVGNYPKSDVFAMICGPIGFNEACFQLLDEMGMTNEQICVFQG